MPEVKSFGSLGGRRILLSAPPLERQQVKDLLIALLVEIGKFPNDIIQEDASIESELQMESAQLAQLGVAIEDELDITVDALEILGLNTFGRIVDYIHDLVR